MENQYVQEQYGYFDENNIFGEGKWVWIGYDRFVNGLVQRLVNVEIELERLRAELEATKRL